MVDKSEIFEMIQTTKEVISFLEGLYILLDVNECGNKYYVEEKIFDLENKVLKKLIKEQDNYEDERKKEDN